MKKFLFVFLLAAITFAGTKSTEKITRNSDPATATENAWNLIPFRFNQAVDDLDSLFDYTTGLSTDSLYKTATSGRRVYVNGNQALCVTKKVSLTATGDFDVTEDNTTEQSICVDSIPAWARLLDAWVVCTDSVMDSGDVSLVVSIDVGSAAGGAQFIGAAEIDCDNDVGAMTASEAYDLAPSATKTPVFINATPDSVWLNIVRGSWDIYLLYNDNASY